MLCSNLKDLIFVLYFLKFLKISVQNSAMSSSNILHPFRLFPGLPVLFWFQDGESPTKNWDEVLTSTAILSGFDHFVESVMTTTTPSVYILFPTNVSSLAEVMFKIIMSLQCTSDTEVNITKTCVTNGVENIRNNWYLICFPSLEIFNEEEVENSLSRLVPSSTPGLELTSRFFILIPNDNSSNNKYFSWQKKEFQLWELYQIKSSVFFRNTMIATDWNNLLLSSLTLPSQRRDFRLTSINALGTCIEQYASECTMTNQSGKLVLESGFAVALFLDLKDSLHFTYNARNSGTFIDFKSLEPGNDETNGAWLLKTKQIDVAISYEIYRPQVAAVFDLVHPTYLSGIKAYFKQPHPSPVSIFVSPFQPTVWMSFLFFWMAMGIIALGIIIVDRCCFASVDNEPLSADLMISKIAPDVFSWIVAVIVQRSIVTADASPRHSTGAKLVFLTIVYVSILWCSAYQGGYVSTLSVRFQPIKSFGQLLVNEYKFILNNRSNSIDNYSKGLFNSYNVSSKKVSKVGREFAPAIISNSRTAYLEYEDSFFGILNVVLRPKNIDPIDFYCNEISNVFVDRLLLPSGFVLQKNSPYRKIFNLKIFHIEERGLKSRYLNHYKQDTKPKCLPIQNNGILRLDLEEVSLGFIILALGVSSSVVFLLLEIALRRC